jgi:hypothetical protein
MSAHGPINLFSKELVEVHTRFVSITCPCFVTRVMGTKGYITCNFMFMGGRLGTHLVHNVQFDKSLKKLEPMLVCVWVTSTWTWTLGA